MDFSNISRSRLRNNGFLVFYKYLDRDFSSQHFLFTFLLQNGLQNWQKVWEIQIFVSKMQKSSKSVDKNQEISKSLNKSQKS